MLYNLYVICLYIFFFFFFQAEDGIRDHCVTGVQTCALPICHAVPAGASPDGTPRGPRRGRARDGAPSASGPAPGTGSPAGGGRSCAGRAPGRRRVPRPAQQRAASWAQTADPAAVRSPGEAALQVAMPEPRRVGPEGGAGCGTARGEAPREATRPAPRSAASPVAAAGRAGGWGR